MNIPDNPQIRTLLSAASLVAIIVGGGVLWGTSQAQSAEQGRIIARMEVLIGQNNTADIGRDVEIRALQLGAGRVDERLINILTGINEIKRQLELRP